MFIFLIIFKFFYAILCTYWLGRIFENVKIFFTRISDTRFTSSLKKFHLYFKNVLYFYLYHFIRLISGITFHDKYFKDKDVLCVLLIISHSYTRPFYNEFGRNEAKTFCNVTIRNSSNNIYTCKLFITRYYKLFWTFGITNFHHCTK